MSPTDRREAAAALKAVLAAVLASGGNQAGEAGADLRRRVGLLSGAAVDRVEAGDFGKDLRVCFEIATDADATFDGMDRVRIVATAFVSERGAVQRVVQTGSRFALIQMSRIVAGTTFVSRSEVDAVLARLNAAFEPAEEFAADRRDNVTYRALVSLHASVVRDLTQRGRPLPRVVTFDVGRRLPALALSNRLYGDGGRAPELIRENRVVHPLFTAGSGTALAN